MANTLSTHRGIAILGATGVSRMIDSADVQTISAPLTNRNLVINGSMQVAQRGDTTGITNANSSYYGPDRYKFNEDGTMTAVVSIAQETLTSGNAFNDGHLYAYKLSVTTDDTAVASDIYTRITHRFEKDNLALLRKGSSSAKRVTLSFWVKATVTGTNVVEFFDQVNSRQVGATYTISSSNTWEYKTVTFPADTSGALGSGSGLAAEINFVLQAGSNYTSGTLDTSWASETTANRAAGHNSNHFSSTSNTFHFTGVQLEVGEQATAFEHEDYATTLKKCLRYHFRCMRNQNYGEFCLLRTYSATHGTGDFPLPVPMRANPTLSVNQTVNGTNFGYTLSSISIGSADVETHSHTYLLAQGGFTANGAAVIQKMNDTNETVLSFDAEL